MNENLWQIIQILMWAFGIQTTLLIAIMGGFYNAINKKFEKINERIDKISDKCEKLNDKIDNQAKELQSINTRLAVLESKVGDLNTNVMHLMWQNQIHPSRDAKEE